MIAPVLRNTLKSAQRKSVDGLNVGDAVVLEYDSRLGLKKGDTGVVSKNSDGYVSAKMDKDGSLIGFRVEENPFKKVVTEGGGTVSETERLDAEYMEAVKKGDLVKCARMVEAAAKKNLRGTQVVDENRNPIKVYHSSRNKSLRSFDIGFVPAGNVGFHFGPKEVADVIHRMKPGRHEPKAYYLDILNPMTFSYDCFGTSDCLYNELAVTDEILNHIRLGGPAYEELQKEFERMDAIVNDDYDSKYTDERYGYSDPKLHKLLLDTLYEAGYDGIVYANSCEGSGDVCWIALEPHQVKSADPITYYDDGTVVPLSKRFDLDSEMVDESRAGDDVVARIASLVSKYDSGELSAKGVADGIVEMSMAAEVPDPVVRFTKAFNTAVDTLGADSEGFDDTIGAEYVDDIRDWCGNPVNEKNVCESNVETSDDAYLVAAKTNDYKLCRKMVEEKAKKAFAGSLLVTKDGMPIKLYHGTAFNIHKFEGGLDTITWVTPDIEYADVYADYDRHPDADNDGVIMSLYVYARNMVDIGDINEPFSEEGVRRIAKAIGCTYDELKSSIGKYSYDFLYEINEYVASIARKKGIDILVAKEGDLDHGVKRKVVTIGVLDFNNIKSADPVTKYEDGTIVPLSKRFDFGTDDIREDDELGDLDVEYLAAVNSNDIVKASKMVRNAAKRSMPDTVVKDFNGHPIITTHGTAFEFNVFKGDVFWFGTSKKILDMYSGEYDKRCFLNITNPFNLDKLGKNFNDLPMVWNNGTYFDSEHKQVKWFNGDGHEYRSHGDALISAPRLKTLSDSTGIPVGRLIEIQNEPMNDGTRILDSQVYAIVNKRSFALELEKLGYDGIIGTESGRRVFGALRPDQIKSAEPVTRDDAGNIIPLSKRFNLSSDDIREDAEEPVPPEPAAEIPPEEKNVELEKPCWKNPDDWKNDDFLVEFKRELGYRDEYFPTKSYSKCADSVAREYTLAMPTDTAARETEGDAVMLLIKSGLEDSIKVAHELGDIVMGNRKGGPRNKRLLKAMQKAYHELVRCSSRFDNDDLNESEECDAAFSRWFRSSVIKDASGNPLVVYHGSSESGITEFNNVRSGNGIFFTSSKEVANDYAVGKENQMYPCYLRIEHPFVIDAHGSKWSDMKFKEHRAVAKHAGYRWITPLEVIGYVTEVYQNKHPECDGIIIRNVVDTNASKVCADDYIVFNPKQIKSVDNNGTFSVDTANIFENN